MVTHPLQSFEWGEFREKTGVKVIREGGFQMTIHKIPHIPWNLGYLPKASLPTREDIEKLQKIGHDHSCIAIQLEPNIILKDESGSTSREAKQFEIIIHDSKFIIRPSVHPLFTKYTFILDLTKSEDELMKNMHSKTRYNIKVAQKHGVEVSEDNSDKAFEEYIRLTEETTKRQKFYAHSARYHRLQWKILPHTPEKDKLTSHLLVAKYQKKIITAWILFVFHDTLYYPYGASTHEHREVMANNLMMWEVIRFGKKLGLQKFDMWGAADVENPSSSHPYYGFHRFKQGYGGEYTEFIGSYDLIINPMLYQLYTIADRLRWFMLRLKK